MSLAKDKAMFYHTLATLLDSGVPLPLALGQRYPRRLASAAAQLRLTVEAGNPLSEGMEACRSLFTPLEINLTKAGETTGRLPDLFRSLDAWCSRQAKIASRLLSGLLYPLFLYLVFCVIMTIVGIFTSQGEYSPTGLILSLVFRLALPFLAFFLLRLLWSLLNTGPGMLLGDLIPVFGSLLHKTETARFFRALGLCLESGLDITRSLEVSASCCRTSHYQRKYRQMADILNRERLSVAQAHDRIATSRDEAAQIGLLLSTGENSGQLDSCALRIAVMQETAAETAIDRLLTILPVVFYLVIAGFIAFKIIAMYSGYIQSISNLM
jgi:MSHA biogenesis protein MshG